MSGTHNKLEYGNNFNHLKILDFSYFSFSNPNPTHLPKHESVYPYYQFSQRI